MRVPRLKALDLESPDAVPVVAHRIRCQSDSTTARARVTSSSMPHLQDAHCRISSVVPMKPPVTRSNVRRYVGKPIQRSTGTVRARPVVSFCGALAGRTSTAGRTSAAHASSWAGPAPGEACRNVEPRGFRCS